MDAFLEDNASFVMFSGEHLAVLICVVLLSVVLPLFARRRLNAKQQLHLGRGMSVLISGTLVAWSGVALSMGHYDWTDDLPIHLCYGLSLFLPVFAWKPGLRTHEVLFYWILSGTLQANLTPRLHESFPHYDFIYYWVTHSGILIYAIYTTVTQRLYPTRRGILRAFAWINVYAAAIFVINSLAGTNYLYLREKPETASLLDFFGPWPWYILVTEIAALLLFGLCYLPFAFIKRSS